MGKRALEAKKATLRTIRVTPLTESERAKLHAVAAYEGSPHHKRNPANFGRTPPAAPRLDKTLCDDAKAAFRPSVQGVGGAIVKEFAIEIADWLSAPTGDAPERETLAALRITAGRSGTFVTEVEDTIAKTVRGHINVAAYPLARWLLVNWWRLRWETGPQNPPSEWLCSHSMASIGGDYAWPPLTFSSDGEFIQLRLQAEPCSDVSAVRYLRDITIDVPAGDFEQAVEEFLDRVEGRLKLRAPGERELSELREELAEERSKGPVARACKLQALSGIDPGSASPEWLRDAEALAAQAGPMAGEEILAVVPALPGGLTEAKAAISAMCASNTTVKLDWAVLKQIQSRPGEIPWELGARLAGELRLKEGIARGPLTNDILSGLLDAKLPLQKTPWAGSRHLRGGYQSEPTRGRTAVLVTSSRDDSQRFELARLIGAALRASDEQHVLPVSDATTALQKFERSFAQEFLCPWQDLDAYTDQFGTDDDAIADAAAHFAVSEKVVLSTLVNKQKVPRSRLLS